MVADPISPFQGFSGLCGTIPGALPQAITLRRVAAELRSSNRCEPWNRNDIMESMKNLRNCLFVAQPRRSQPTFGIGCVPSTAGPQSRQSLGRQPNSREFQRDVNFSSSPASNQIIPGGKTRQKSARIARKKKAVTDCSATAFDINRLSL